MLSLLSRVPSGVLASAALCIANHNVRDRPFSLDSTPSRIGSTAWFLSCVVLVCFLQAGDHWGVKLRWFGPPLSVRVLLHSPCFCLWLTFCQVGWCSDVSRERGPAEPRNMLPICTYNPLTASRRQGCRLEEILFTLQTNHVVFLCDAAFFFALVHDILHVSSKLFQHCGRFS